jgi:hypothetical protein
MKKSGRCSGGHFKRRDFLRVGSLSFLGISLSQYLELRHTLAAVGGVDKNAKAQSCILLWLDGGPSQIDTWDPKPNSNFRPISTNVPGIQISELFPRLAKKMDKLAIIRSMKTEENNHGVGHHYALTGHRPSPAMKFPGIGSIITKELGAQNDVPPHVIVPEVGTVDAIHQFKEFCKGHFLGAQYDPMVIHNPNPPEAEEKGAAVKKYIEDFEVPDLSLPKSLTVDRLRDRSTFLELVDSVYRRKVERAKFAQMDSFREQALNIILSSAGREAFDISREPRKTREAYGKNAFGQSVLLARRLVEAGSRFVTAAGYRRGAWDTHFYNDTNLRDLGPPLDQTLSTLLEDLEQRGLLESTLIIVMGEFGRTGDINPEAGRDHWCHCWSLLLGGGGIRGGTVVGASNERGEYPTERVVTIGDLFATIYKALGIDWHKEYMHPIGRPLKIANSIDDETGTPIHELI